MGRHDGKNKETQGNTSLENTGNPDIENILQQLAVGMVNLQKTVGSLADSLQKCNSNNSSNADRKPIDGAQDRAYILHWRELGGSSLSFYPSSKVHPMQFLSKLNKTLEEAGVPEERKINLAVNCLKGAAADWVAIKEVSFKKYDDFARAFKDRYWGLDKQRELFLEISYGRYESGSRSDYFLNLASQTRFLSQKMSDAELIDKISKHFSSDIRRGIITQGLNTMESVEEYLRQIDEMYLEEQRSGSNATSRIKNYDKDKKYEPRFNRNTDDNPRIRNRNDDPIERNQNNSDNRRNINLITKFNRSQENLLESGDEDENTKDSSVIPVIRFKIAGKEVDILLDSGSEVSAISEKLFREIKERLDVPVLPVTGVTISVAVGGKTQRIRQQTLVPILINNGCIIDCTCLIIPNLNRDMLLGCDFLSKHKAYLDFENLKFNINVDEKMYSADFIYSTRSKKSLQVNFCDEKNIGEINLSEGVYDRVADGHEHNDTDFRLVNYEQRFCQNYADLAIPLVKLLKKGVKWTWGVEQIEAFKNIKKSFLEVAIMSHPRLEETFFVQCDSSDYGLGGCLYQVNSETGDKMVIAYTSRTLKGSELNYTTTEKETLAIVHCFRQWRTLILGRQLVVVTDHKSLTFLLKCDLRTARLTRWVMFLQEFDFLIVHCKGVDNVIADVLSRQPLKTSKQGTADNTNNVEISLIAMTSNYKELRRNFRNIRADQLGDDCFGTKIEFLEKMEKEVKVFTEKELSVLNWYVLHDGVLFRRGTTDNKGFKLCVPKNRKIELMRAQHEEIGHFGKAKTYNHMKGRFYWPKMLKHIRQLVASCELCQKSKVAKTSVGLLSPIVVNKPGELVCLDLVGPLPKSRGGATVLLVIVDAFSKYVKLYALKRATTVTLLNKVMKDYIPGVQKPKCILSDNGSQFTSQRWKNTLGNVDIQIKTTSVYFPQGNITERYNKEVGRLLRVLCHEKHSKWAGEVKTVESLLNNVVSETTGFTPNFVQRGEAHSNFIEKVVSFPDEELTEKLSLEQIWVLARDRLISKAQRRAAKANKTRKPIIFKEGNQVLVKAHTQSSAENRTIRKFFLLYEGPFYVLGQAGPNSYVIGDEHGRVICKQNVVNLKLYNAPMAACD